MEEVEGRNIEKGEGGLEKIPSGGGSCETNRKVVEMQSVWRKNHLNWNDKVRKSDKMDERQAVDGHISINKCKRIIINQEYK